VNLSKKSLFLFLPWLLFGLASCQTESPQQILPATQISKIDQKEMVLVPAGKFIMGTDKTDPENTHQKIGTIKPLYLDQHPQRSIDLEAFYMDKYEVTHREYMRFVEATRFNELPSNWVEGKIPEGLKNHPVTNITWREALAYALWAGKLLPTEEQWEKAARGTDGRLYPWGNEYAKGMANMGIDAAKKNMPVGSYPQDVSSYGLYDMGGNVMEWSLDWYLPYPGNDYQSPKFGKKLKVLRGNSFQSGGHYFLEAYRYVFSRTEVDPDDYFENVGFRCVMAVNPPH